MAAFNIYLGEIGTTGLSATEKSDLKTKLEGWFGKIVDTGDTALVSWTSSEPASIQDHELLVYYVGSSGKLHLDDANLHKKDGLAVATVPIGGQPSANNISDMKKALKNKNKQWTGGWLAYADPINGYI